MALAEAVRNAMAAKGLIRRQLLERVQRESSRWAVYRILSGKSADPRLSTVLVLCQALDISPTELIQMAGFVPHIDRRTTSLDVRLRQTFAAAQALPIGVRELAVMQIEAAIETLGQWQKGRNGGGPTDLPQVASA